ncbi:MAG: hypothetical protein AB7N65_28675 [Vicinamibacterales bacterium]
MNRDHLKVISFTPKPPVPSGLSDPLGDRWRSLAVQNPTTAKVLADCFARIITLARADPHAARGLAVMAGHYLAAYGV